MQCGKKKFVNVPFCCSITSCKRWKRQFSMWLTHYHIKLFALLVFLSCTGVLNVLTSLYKVEAKCMLCTSSAFPCSNCLPLNMVACRQKMCEYGDDIKQHPFWSHYNVTTIVSYSAHMCLPARNGLMNETLAHKSLRTWTRLSDYCLWVLQNNFCKEKVKT